MSKRKSHTTLVHKFADFDFDKFKEVYLYQISEHIEQKFIPSISPEDYKILNPKDEEGYLQFLEKYNQKEYVHYKAKRGVKGENKILAKTLYIQDLIIRKSYSKKDNGIFRLSSDVLRKVIGDEYKTLLGLFISFGFLNHGDGFNGHKAKEYYYYYEPMKGSTMYSLPPNLSVSTELTNNHELIKLKEKEKSIMEGYYKTKILPEIDKRYGLEFRTQYEKSLRKIKISNDHELDEYIKKAIEEYIVNKEEETKKIEKDNKIIDEKNKIIDEENKRIDELNAKIEDKEEKIKKKRRIPRRRKKKQGNPMIEHYYKSLVERLGDKDKKISRIDNAGRIYHVLTNADRNIKKYLNIDISADCRNSHPLLFNYFIFISHGISVEDAYKISNAMHQIKGNNIIEELQTYLSKSIIEKFYRNELEYIYLTSNGIFWDKMLTNYDGLNRNEVKVEMFQQVFYSKNTQVKFYQEKAKDFKKSFPTVMQLILKWKKEEYEEMRRNYMSQQGITEYETGNALSIAMMNLEARIFTEILKRMYSRRWNAIHIHDCIIIPETNNRNKPTKEDVIQIMNDVYKKYGLSPTFSD